jgi:hypothetical protein
VLASFARGQNVAFLVGLAFAVAASANLPTILFSLYWKRFTTSGAVTGILVGLIGSLLLVVIGPNVMGPKGLTLPMSTSCGFELTSGPMKGRVVGPVVLPAPPDHPCPGAGEDAHGVGVVAAAGDGLAVDLGRPRRGASGVVGEGRHGLSQPLVAGPPEAHVAVGAGGVGDRAQAPKHRRRVGLWVGWRQSPHSASIWAALI